MVLSRSIVLAHVSLLIGLTGFGLMAAGCSSGGEEKAQVESAAPDAVAKSETPAPGGEAAESSEEGKEAAEGKEGAESEEHEAKEQAAPPTPKADVKPAPAKPAPTKPAPAKPAPAPGKVVAAGVSTPCADCHDDLVKTKHVLKGVSCVSCHMQTAAHLEDPSKHPTQPKERADCFKCHSVAASAKSGAIKQVDSHGGKLACVKCHSIHKEKKGA